jgi:hypothetical protein
MTKQEYLDHWKESEDEVVELMQVYEDNDEYHSTRFIETQIYKRNTHFIYDLIHAVDENDDFKKEVMNLFLTKMAR